jgi:beta-lactam-binding protein with PASTA domain
MLLAITAIALAAAGVAIAYFLTHRDNGSSTTTLVTSSPGTAPATSTKTMPALTGKKLATAKAALAALAIEPSVTRELSKRPAGTVIAQAPVVGAKLTSSSSVTLVVAQGRKHHTQRHPAPTKTASTPTTTSAPTTTAPTTTTQPATTAPTTTAASPPQPQNATVPDVSDETESAAVDKLNQAGILTSLFFVPSNDPLGTVEQQAKAAGSTVPYHSHVQINVSQGPGDKPSEQVPNVVGQTLKQALASINGAHLRLLYVRFPVTSRSQAGKIVQQSPLGGGHAPQNAQVLVFLGSLR